MHFSVCQLPQQLIGAITSLYYGIDKNITSALSQDSSGSNFPDTRDYRRKNIHLDSMQHFLDQSPLETTVDTIHTPHARKKLNKIFPHILNKCVVISTKFGRIVFFY